MKTLLYRCYPFRNIFMFFGWHFPAMHRYIIRNKSVACQKGSMEVCQLTVARGDFYLFLHFF